MWWHDLSTIVPHLNVSSFRGSGNCTLKNGLTIPQSQMIESIMLQTFEPHEKNDMKMCLHEEQKWKLLGHGGGRATGVHMKRAKKKHVTSICMRWQAPCGVWATNTFQSLQGIGWKNFALFFHKKRDQLDQGSIITSTSTLKRNGKMLLQMYLSPSWNQKAHGNWSKWPTAKLNMDILHSKWQILRVAWPPFLTHIHYMKWTWHATEIFSDLLQKIDNATSKNKPTRIWTITIFTSAWQGSQNLWLAP